jgi:hypothetical protein
MNEYRSEVYETKAESDDEVDRLSEESFLGDLKRLSRWLKAKRVAILVALLWTAALSFLIAREYALAYDNLLAWNPDYKVAFAPTLSNFFVPRLDAADYVVFLTVSVLAGFAIGEIESVLFGFAASMMLAFLTTVVYGTVFIWYVLDFGSLVNLSFLTTIMWAAFLNVFRMIFPIAVITVFFGSIVGSIVRDVVQR